MREIRKSWKKRAISAAMAVILMIIPVIAVHLTGITARAGEVVLEDRYGMDLLDKVPFEFYGGSSRYGMRAYFADGKPVFGLEQGKLLYDKAAGYQTYYSTEESLPLNMTREQAELLFYALEAAGATEPYGKDISPGSYAMVQATVWAVMSGQWTDVETFKTRMEELETHLAREEWRQAFSRCLLQYCEEIEKKCGWDAVPMFASAYEGEAPIHKMTAGEDGIYRVTLETNGQWWQDSLYYDLPEGWGYTREGRNITFFCANGKPDSGVITGYFPPGIEPGKGWRRPAKISVIEPSGEDWDLKQTLLCPAGEESPWKVYLRFAGSEENANGTYRMEYHLYRHREILEADYLIRMEKFCSETGKPLEDTAFQVLEGFDAGQLSGTNLDPFQFPDSEELAECGLPVYTGSDGKAEHHDRMVYQYDKTYCGGHPLPVVAEMRAGESASEPEKEAVERWNQLAREDARAAWQECVDWCEKYCDFHSIDGEDSMGSLKEDRRETYHTFTGVKWKYAVREAVARPGYILYGLHNEDNPEEVREVLPIQYGKRGGEQEVISENITPMARQATASDALKGTGAKEKATPGDADIFPKSISHLDMERQPWTWGGVLEKSRIRPIDRNTKETGSGIECFRVGGHRIEGEVHILKKDLEIHRREMPVSMDDSEGRGKTQGDATLEGAVYGLYADEDIVHPDGKTGIVFARGDLVSMAATDVNGDASFLCITEETETSKQADNLLEENLKHNGSRWIGAPLLLGKYYVKEITRSEGYELSQNGMDLPESNREAGQTASTKKGKVSVRQVPRNVNGWDGSWNEFKVSFFNTDQIEITVCGYPLNTDFMIVEKEELVSEEEKVESLKIRERLDQTGQPVYKKAEGGEYRFDETGNVRYKSDQNGMPVYTKEPEMEGYAAAMYVQPVLNEEQIETASLSDAVKDRKKEGEKREESGERGRSVAAKAMSTLKAAGYKECTEDYPWALLPLHGKTEEEMAREITEWCVENHVWDSFLVEDIVERDGTEYGVVRYGYSVLDGARAIYHPDQRQLIVRKEWDQGFYYVVYGEEDYVKNGLYFVVEKRMVRERPREWDPIEPETVYLRLADTYLEGETLSDLKGNPVPELETVGAYEPVPVVSRKETLLPLGFDSYMFDANQHGIVIDTSHIDWNKQKEPLELTIRVILPSKTMTVDGEVMAAGDFYRRFSNMGYSVAEGAEKYDVSTYIEKVFLRYPGAEHIYEDGSQLGEGTRKRPIEVLQRVIKQPVKIEKIIEESSYGSDNTYNIHRDPFTERMGGYGGQKPALSAEGFQFQCYLKSDLLKTGLLENGEDGLPDYEGFFRDHGETASRLALEWEEPDEDTDGDLTILSADKVELGEDKTARYSCVSKMLPYGTYVIRELPPLDFPNNSYQTDRPKEILIPSVPVTDEGGTVHGDRYATEYLYDAEMRPEEMENRYHIRFQDESHVILAHNNDGDFPVYKYGAGTKVSSLPYPNRSVGQYYHFGGAEKPGIIDSVYYETLIDRDGKEEHQVTKTDVASMTGKTVAVDRIYAQALVPWSVLAPGNSSEKRKTEGKEGEFAFVSYAVGEMENSLYRAKLRIQKKDRETGELIRYDEAIFQLFAASRDISVDEDGKLSGSGAVLFDEAGFPIYDEREPIILVDRNGQVTDKIQFFSTGNQGLYETCQPLGSGAYVLKEVKAPDGYVRAKPVAFEIYSGQVFYYKDGDRNRRTEAELYRHDERENLDIWQIDVENDPTEISIHKVEKGDSKKYVSGAELKLYRGVDVKKTGEHQYENVEVVRRPNGEIKDILLHVKGMYGTMDRKVSLWRYDLAGSDVKLDEETGIWYGLNETGVPICMVDGETGMAFVPDQGKRCLVCPLEDGERIPAKLWNGKEAQTASWKTGKEGRLFRSIPWGYYVLEESGVPRQDGYVQALLMGIHVEEKKERQEFVMEDGFTSCQISIVDSTTGETVTGAGMTLYPAERVPDDSSKGYHLEKKLDEEGKPYSYASWTSSPHPYRLDHIPVGDYILEEHGVPYTQGYTKTSPMEIKIEEREDLQVIVMEAEHTLLEVQKTDKLTGKEMPEDKPATLTLYKAKLDESGIPVQDREGIPGYLEEQMVLQWKTNVKSEGTPSKVKIPGTLRGTYYRTGEGHIRFEYLPVGYYVLVETGVPAGFASAKPVLIQIRDEGNLSRNHLVRMTDAPLCVSISKQGTDGTEKIQLYGALLAVYEKKADGSRGEKIDAWKTGMDGRYTEEDRQRGCIPVGRQAGDWKPHVLTYLTEGDYILVEEQAPFGWARAKDIHFSVKDTGVNDGKPLEIVMTDPPVLGEVTIFKTDDSGQKGLPGAEFTIKNRQTGEETSLITGGDGYGKSEYLPVGTTGENGIFRPYTYEIREVKAPDGYELSSAVHEFEFSYVDDLHPLLTYFYQASNQENQIKISKMLKNKQEFLPGALLQVVEKETGTVVNEWISSGQAHYINGLSRGAYLLKEVETPGKGYRKAGPLEFTVTGRMREVLSLTMYDEHTTLSVEKRAADTGKALPGALLELKNQDGSLVRVWTTETSPEYFYGLEPGDYLLSETKAPAGYEIAKDMVIRLEDKTMEQNIIMTDRRTKTPSPGGGNGKENPPSGEGKIEAVQKSGYITAFYQPEEIRQESWLVKMGSGLREWAGLPAMGEPGWLLEMICFTGILLGVAVAAALRKKRGMRFYILAAVALTSISLFLGVTEVWAAWEKLPDENVEIQEGGRVLFREYWSAKDTPPQEWLDTEEGKRYRLREWERIPDPVTDREKEVYGQITYRGIEKKSSLPGMAKIKVEDEESGSRFSVEMPLIESEFLNETWSDDFQFTMIFHDYGADNYKLGASELQLQGEELDVKQYEEEILSLIGVEMEAYQVTRLKWQGEPYVEENGTLCRDALVSGKKKVGDCIATYGGTVKLPDVDGYRFQMKYQLWEEEKIRETAGKEHVETLPAGTEEEMEEKEAGGLWGVIKKYVVLTVGVVLFLLAAAGARLVWIYIKSRKEKREKKTKK